MSVYKKFNDTDILRTVINASSRLDFSSGSSGWRGNLDGSSSVSVFSGIRAVQRTGIQVTPTFKRNSYTIDGVLDVTGSYPFSSSLKYVKARSEGNSTVDGLTWGEKHWDPLMLLYEYHSRYNPEYNTGSYDYYSVFFKKGSANILAKSGSSATTWNAASSSFTFEFWIKPFLTSSATGDFTIANRNGVFHFAITGSTGQLVFYSPTMGRFTSSFGPEERRWSHVVVRGSTGTGSFLVNLNDAGTFSYTTGSMTPTTPSAPTITIGNVYSSPTVGGDEQGFSVSASGALNRSFHGLIHESRFWSTRRTDAQISASYNSVLFTTGSQQNLIAYYRMNQGPLYQLSGLAIGSGVLDHSTNNQHLAMGSFVRPGPVWHPNDNDDFYSPKSFAVQTQQPNFLRVINIPSLMYGRQIQTGSLTLTCRSYSSSSLQLVRVLKDDGRGGLYISGSICSSSIENKESYAGVTWNKVGNVFYSEGIVVIKDPALFDFGCQVTDGAETLHSSDMLSVNFSGLSKIPSVILMCRAGTAEYNASNNITFSEYDDSIQKYVLQDESRTTWITAVGLYDKERRLVGVAKLASPIRKREKDKLNLKIKIDF